MKSSPELIDHLCTDIGGSMNNLKQVEQAVLKLSPQEQENLRDWLENLLEDRLEMTDEFKAEIAAGKADIAAGRARIRRP
ncbi:MAG: hypothetical protein FJ403_15560 [Verrucomicrobia bacterium]|nr:hypothetical protein [Verrucomicrobiota bacterium]